MDQEELQLIKRWLKHDPYDKVDRIAQDYGTTPKELKKKIFKQLRLLIEEYEILRKL